MNRPPVLPAYLDGLVAVVACPYCGQEHRHGRLLGDAACQPVDGSRTCACVAGTPTDGPRKAPCDPDGPGYVLVVLTPTTPATMARVAAEVLGREVDESYEAVRKAFADLPDDARLAALERAIQRCGRGVRRAAKYRHQR